ncbi:MAG: WbqC family protein [Saprospiraceae bacterium]|nr:WbqC family protein [Saprospiraceae bacterium]
MNSKDNQILLIESMLFPPVVVMSHISHYQTIVLEARENYQKKSYRNRFELGSVQGPISLSVPLVKGKHQQQVITETKYVTLKTGQDLISERFNPYTATRLIIYIISMK